MTDMQNYFAFLNFKLGRCSIFAVGIVLFTLPTMMHWGGDMLVEYWQRQPQKLEKPKTPWKGKNCTPSLHCKPKGACMPKVGHTMHKIRL